MTRDEARRAIGMTAGALLAGALSYIEGARKIVSLRFSAGLERDPDILPFVGIDSETDALPMGDFRYPWDPEALRELQPKIDRAEQSARELCREYCERLVKRFEGDVPDSDSAMRRRDWSSQAESASVSVSDRHRENWEQPMLRER